MIDSIEITNWKTHKKTAMNFQKGVNVLIGVMGAGKSSAMDAISFGLYGTFPALNSKRVTLAELITNRPTRETEAEVKINFTIGGDSYTVTRKIGGNGNTAKLEKNGQYLQAQPTKVTEEIENILKIDYDTFSRVVYAEQNQLDYFLGLAKGARKKEIDHMLGLDTFALAEENTTSLVNKLKDMVKAEEDALSRIDEKELRSELKKLTNEKATMQKEQEKLQRDEQKLKGDVEETRKELETLKKKLAEMKSITDEVERLAGKKATIVSEIKKIDALKIDEKALSSKKAETEKREAALKKEMDELGKESISITKTIAELDTTLRQNQKKIAERERIIKETKGGSAEKIKKQVEEENKALRELTDMIATKRSRVSELGEWLKELNKHISKCPVCERALDDKLKSELIANKKKLAESLEKESRESAKTADEKSKMIKELTELHNKLLLAGSKIEEYSDLGKKVEQDSKEKEAAEKKLEIASERLNKITKEHDVTKELLNKVKNDIQTAERRKGYDDDIKKTEALIEEKSRQLSLIHVDDKTLYSTQDVLTKQSAEHSEVNSKLQGNARLMANVDGQVRDKEKQIKSIEDATGKIAKRQKQVQSLNKFKSALIDTEAMLRNRLVASINGLMQGLWPQLYPYGDYASIQLEALRDDYLLEVDAGRGGASNWMQVDGIASGGERSVACLAMRIALAMVIVPNLKWLILDEPTHNIDAAGISKMISIFGEELPGVVDQIFIITHEEALKQITSARVYTLERDKAANEPTSIAEI